MLKNLLSLGKFAVEVHYMLFGPKNCWIFDRNNLKRVLVISSQDHCDSSYHLNTSIQGQTTLALTKLLANLVTTQFSLLAKLWHQCTTHLNL